MEIPKPGPRKGYEKISGAATDAALALVEVGETAKEAVKPKEKPPFVRKPHLTQRPFKNPQIVALRSQMQRSNNKKR